MSDIENPAKPPDLIIRPVRRPPRRRVQPYEILTLWDKNIPVYTIAKRLRTSTATIYQVVHAANRVMRRKQIK